MTGSKASIALRQALFFFTRRPVSGSRRTLLMSDVWERFIINMKGERQ